MALHPDNTYDCERCQDAQKIKRICNRPLKDGSLPPDHGGERCPVLRLDIRSQNVLRALWMAEHGMLSANDVDAWYIGAIQYASVDKARQERKMMEIIDKRRRAGM